MLQVGSYVEAYKGFLYNSTDSLADIQAAFAQIYANAANVTLSIDPSTHALVGVDSTQHGVLNVADGMVVSVPQGSQYIKSWNPNDVTLVNADYTANITLSVSGTADISRS